MFIHIDFNNFIKHVSLSNYVNFEQLKVDIQLFSGSYLESSKLLDAMGKSSAEVVDPMCQPKRCMQQISCYIRQNDLLKAAKQLSKLIDLVNLDLTIRATLTNPTVSPSRHDSSSSDSSTLIAYCDLDAFIELQNSSTTRQLILMPMTLNNVFGFIIDCCICLLKELIDSPLEQDLAIGHLIVLSQFSWPYYFETFSSMMEKLDARASAGSSMSKFVYPLFTIYVSNSDVIETIMGRVDLPNFTFELAPATPLDFNQPLNLHSTRGASRTYRDDITALIHKQMERSLDEMPIDLLRNFLLFQMNPYLGEMYKLNK